MRKHWSILPLLAALAAGACDEAAGGDGAARLSIRLTDAPADLAEAWVRIDRIYLQGEGRFDVLDARTGWVDLLTLSGGRTAELVDGAVVPAGRYSELRFVVCEAYLVTREGKTYATSGASLPSGVTAQGQLIVPSGCASGVKVKFPGGDAVELEEGATILTVDFDVSQSFGHQAGASGRWVMHPVMHATEVGFSGGIAGTVSTAAGVVFPACGGGETDVTVFVPRATAGGSTFTSAVGEDGRYRTTVAAGTWAISHAPALGFENGDSLMVAATPSAASVTVAAGTTATADYSVTEVTCKPAS
jgi:hypothetical protein